METTLENIEQHFLRQLEDLAAAPVFAKNDKRSRLLSQADVLLREATGRDFLFDKIEALVEAGIFHDTVWQTPNHLVAGLIGGTLLAGPGSSTLEALSELRLLAVAEGKMAYPDFSAEAARSFLQSALVENFDLACEQFHAPAWEQYPAGELKKIRLLFDLVWEKIPLRSIKKQLSEEIETHSAHRPINTSKVKRILQEVDKKLPLDGHDPTDGRLVQYRRALLAPTPAAEEHPSQVDYSAQLGNMTAEKLREECQLMGEQIVETGLVSLHHVSLLHHVAERHPDLVPDALCLDAHGKAEFERHRAFVLLLIAEFITPAMEQAVYGLARVLQRNLFSQKITWHAFNRLLRIRLAPSIEQKLRLGNQSGKEASPIQLLVSGALCVLGQPLGVRQGNNPTCQSARGISMWSRNAPGKLINMLIDAAVSDNLIFRFEGTLVESAKTGAGLVQNLDYKLDPVSIVLVPHLDRIYNEMMNRATFRNPGTDPHISVNPAFYGHWIQTGFRSVFNPVLQKIERFDEFVRIFYASYHPEYNGGYHLSYPVPLGIFITDATGQMLGYHAVSLLRVNEDESGEWRAYFFNPNSEGKQNWGQGIRPSVSDKGERHGESSLPFYQFVARLYAYHFNQLRLGDRHWKVPKATVGKIEKLARESWGQKYVW